MLVAYGAGAVFGNIASGSAIDRWGSGPVVVALNASAIYAGMAAGTGVGGVVLGSGPRAVPLVAAVLAVAALLYAWLSGRRATAAVT